MVVTEGETDCEPPVAVLEVHEAEQEVALVEDQESVEELPKMTEEGEAERLTVGTASVELIATLESKDSFPTSSLVLMAK